MSESLGLGKLITTEQHQDAIHIAVAPVTATEKLYPGQRIGFVDDKNDKVVPNTTGPGIVDPFLELPVYPDQKCWMYMRPGSITSLRHEWTHPAFVVDVKPTITKEQSHQWLVDFAQRADLSYEDLMSGANRFLSYGNYLCDGGKWESFAYDFTPSEFWGHYERVTGEIVGSADRDSTFFSCSC